MENAENSTKVRNKQFDLMRAIGIIAVIWGHNYQPPFLFFPSFYFQIALFFFISGYFFKPSITLKEKALYVIKKTRSQLLPYLALNVLFGLITVFLAQFSIKLGGELTLHNVFIAPFEGGDQYALFLAAWFLFNLYFVSIFAGMIYQKNSKVNLILIFLAIVIMLIFLQIGTESNLSNWMIFLIRSCFGFAIFSLGYLLKMYEERVRKYIIKPATMVILFVIVDILGANFGTLSYSIKFGNVTNPLFIVPVISTLCIILIIYSICYYVTKVLRTNSIAYEIGRNSYAIMVWHLLIFFLINYALYLLHTIPFSALSDVYYRYNIEKLWIFYQIPAFIIPVLMARIYHRGIEKFKALPW